MGHSMLILVSDNFEVIQSAKSFANHHGLVVKVYSTSEWEAKNAGTSPTLNMDVSMDDNVGATILPFRPGSEASSKASPDQVCTMNELESVAIKNAIFKFKGNLTEASKALGIGRATLYRKVKQYNIDPSEARRRRVA